MKISVRKWAVALLAVAAFVVAACGGESGGASNGSLTVTPDGENLAYNNASLSAPAGKVTLTFNNTSAAQSHNIVIVKGGEDVVVAVDEAAAEAGDAAGYIPADTSNILANTAMLAPGASETVEFTAEAGTYTFICTYPGHYGGGMQGTLTIN
ncbi:MAG: plastocyanin/azurin family copper-binding protein [Roseiflexaceae bacterium]